MPKETKARQCKLDEIREVITPAQDNQLMAIANQPNPQLKKIQELLAEWGFHASLNAVSTWYKRHLKSGIKAYGLNQRLQDYSGINVPNALEKLLVDAVEELDDIVLRIKGSNNVNDNEYLRVLPALRRTAVQAIEAYSRVNQLGEKAEIEFSGALRLANYLRETFKGTEYASALETAIKGGLGEFSSETEQ